MPACVIIGGGPSLTINDVLLVEAFGLFIIGINNAYQICGQLNVLYGCDAKWWQKHHNDVPEQCCKFSLEDTGFDDVVQLKQGKKEGLSLRWPWLNTGRNGGYQALNLAVLLGFKTIYLLGYDMKRTGGKTHWHGEHPQPLNNPSEHLMQNWIEHYKEAAKILEGLGITVINLTRKTALQCFPIMRLEDALQAQ
jgi:hypothetical protein